MMRDLDLLDAEILGFGGMDFVQMLPGVLREGGQLVKVQEDKVAAKKAAAESAKKAEQGKRSAEGKGTDTTAASSSGLWAEISGLPMPVKVAGGAAALGLLLYAVKR